MTTRQALEATRDLLDNGNHWIKAKAYDGETKSYCLASALGAASAFGDWSLEAPTVLFDAITVLYGKYDYLGIAQFNDSLSTKWSDVEAVINYALEHLDA